MVVSVQAPNRATPARTAVSGAESGAESGAAAGAAGLVALLGRGAGQGQGDGFAELVAETRSLNAISGSSKVNSRPRLAAAEAPSRTMENFAARLQRDIDRLKARNQAASDAAYSPSPSPEQPAPNSPAEISRSESPGSPGSPESPPPVARKAATRPNSGADSQSDPSLDQLSPEEKQELIDRLSRIMASLVPTTGEAFSATRPRAAGEGANGSPRALSHPAEESKAADDPMLDLAATVLAMFLAAAKAEAATDTSTPAGEASESGLDPITGLPFDAAAPAGSSAPSPDLAAAAMDADILEFVQKNSAAIRKAFAEAVASQAAASGPGDFAGTNAAAAQNSAATPLPSPSLPPPAWPSATPTGANPGELRPETPRERLTGLLAATGGAVIDPTPASPAPAGAEATAASNDKAAAPVTNPADPDPSLLPAANSVVVLAAKGQAQTESHSLHSTDSPDHPIAAVGGVAPGAAPPEDGRDRSGDFQSSSGESTRTPLPGVAPTVPSSASPAGNDFASLVAQSNFLNGSGSPSQAPSLLAANQGQPTPQGLQPMAEQLARPMFQAAVLGQASLTVQIHPATLGMVRISLTVDEGKRVKVAISVTRPETLNLLQNDTQSLHQALRDAGLLTDDQSLHFSLDQSGGQNQPSPSFYSHRSPSHSLTALQELEETPLEAPRLPSSSLVDIQI